MLKLILLHLSSKLFSCRRVALEAEIIVAYVTVEIVMHQVT
uniref:Uncharacterized protein n=1 Tax=Arundo donax TaxID=35708 RepID=A0A0A9F7A9_ARUDO